MKTLRNDLRFAACYLLAATSVAAHAQPFPSKVIRIVTSQPGASADITSRLITEDLQQTLGQPIIIDNRGGGVIAGSLVAKAPPDGHTILHYGSTLWLLPLMRDDVPYDPVRDFVPVTGSIGAINVLVVHPSLPVRTVKDLVALARSRPGQLDYSSAAAGTANHLAAELFLAKAGVKIRRIPYSGATASLNAVIIGEVQISLPTFASASPFVGSDRLRILGVTTTKPSEMAPGIPTVASFVPGYEYVARSGFFAPAGTPAVIVNRLHKEIVTAMTKPATRERLKKAGVEVNGTSPQEFGATIQKEIQEYGRLFKQLGIRDQG